VRNSGGLISPLYDFKKIITYGKNLDEIIERRGFCMVVRGGYQFKRIMDYYCENHNSETLVIYSMWDGYLKQKSNPYSQILESFCNTEHLHTSGHASRETIYDVCRTVAPRQAIIPIHCSNTAAFDNFELTYTVKHLGDGEVYRL
jgi:hypothetical protein